MLLEELLGRSIHQHICMGRIACRVIRINEYFVRSAFLSFEFCVDFLFILLLLFCQWEHGIFLTLSASTHDLIIVILLLVLLFC